MADQPMPAPSPTSRPPVPLVKPELKPRPASAGPIGGGRLTFADQIAAEEQQVHAGAAGCGHRCDCHSPDHACIRLEHPDVDGDRAPHVTRLPDGMLMQWTGPCPPPGWDPNPPPIEPDPPVEHASIAAAVIDAIVAHKKTTGRLPWD